MSIGFGSGILSTLASKVISVVVPPKISGSGKPILGSAPGSGALFTVTLSGINTKPFGIISVKTTLVRGLRQVLVSWTVYVTVSPTFAIGVLIVLMGIKIGSVTSLKETSSIA